MSWLWNQALHTRELFKMLTYPVGDMVATRRALEKYADMDPTFPSTREYQLLVDLADQVEAGDQDVFAGMSSHFRELYLAITWTISNFSLKY